MKKRKLLAATTCFYLLLPAKVLLCMVNHLVGRLVDNNQESLERVPSEARLNSATGINVPLSHQKSQTIPITVIFRAGCT